MKINAVMSRDGRYCRPVKETVPLDGESGSLEPESSAGGADKPGWTKVSFFFIAPSLRHCTKWLGDFVNRMEVLKEQSDWGPMHAALVLIPEECREFGGDAVLKGEWVCQVELFPPVVSSALEEVVSEMEEEIPLMDFVSPQPVRSLEDEFGVLFSSSNEMKRYSVRLPIDIETDEEVAALLRSVEEEGTDW